MLKVVLGSTSESKKSSIDKAFNDLDIFDYEIVSVPVDSKVSSKPINEEILIGAKNRNNELLDYCKSNNIDFDILISIEGGYEQVGNSYFLVSYASTYNAKTGNEAIGKSQGLLLTKKMFEWAKSGKSLNQVIESIIHTEGNKRANGLSGYLTNGYYYRSYFDSSAVISALQCLNNLDYYQELDNKLV
jgi:non-canonical (house-cleaning) NTP pyrophosphatase